MAAQRLADITLEELRLIIQQEIARSTVIQQQEEDLDDFPVDDVGAWPERLTLRREEIYSDDI